MVNKVVTWSIAALVVASTTSAEAQGVLLRDALTPPRFAPTSWTQPCLQATLRQDLGGAGANHLFPLTRSLPPAREVSPGKAFLLSLLLPGLGERACGASTRGWAFTATEAGLWAGVVSFRLYGHWRTEDYRAYAVAKAGVDPEDKPHRYFVDIGNYPSLEAYNAAMLRDRNLPKVYPETEAYFWRWPSEVERIRYAHLRVSADKAYQRSVLLIGAVLANHLVSAIDAMWVAKRTQQHPKQSMVDVDVDFAYSPAGARVGVTVMRHF